MSNETDKTGSLIAKVIVAWFVGMLVFGSVVDFATKLGWIKTH